MPTYPIRRRPRECKTCLPCRASKVRCDRNVPCGNCVKRNFTCSYGRPPPTAPRPASFIPDQYASSATTPATNTPQYMPSAAYQSAAHRDGPYGADPESASSANQDGLSEMVTLSQEEWDEINSKMQTMEQILTSLGSLFQAHGARKVAHSRSEPSQEQEEEDDSPASEGIYGSTTLRTNSVHIGSRSALVDILDKSKVSEDTAQALPKDDLLTELAMGNESAAYPFVDLWSSDPYTFNISGVCSVLPDDEQCRKFLAFYRNIGAVLYPVLPDLVKFEADMNKLLQGRQAAGGVYSPDANGLVKPFGMSVSFLSLLFAVLASGSQLSDLPGKERELTSWAHLTRCWVSNIQRTRGSSSKLTHLTERNDGAWAMAFQNSHFSLAYDRPSITMINQPEIPYDPKSMPGHRGYFETLCRLIQVVLDMLRGLMFTHHSHLRYHEIREYKQRIERIIAEAAPHLKSRERCATLGEHIERTELRLHSSYFISLMCRVSLDPDTPMDEQRREIVREDCLTNLINTIEAFIELHSINSHASRTWISLQRTIASAFLLVANNNDQLHPQTWDLIEKLEAALSDHVHDDTSSDHNSKTDTAKHLASSLHALREVSAAFRARKTRHRVVPKVVPSLQNTSPATSFASPSSTLGSGVPAYSSSQSVSPDGHIDNILNQVSDVMLFPSMSSGNA
ncbi:hypothetical protein AtubIFM55763_009126 [Aspergillus tubingensis]|uniref:Zn(2)-C6 fungal-type domain-containing protein n=1 Tax=Aspergillus tubingensis TaxID=5068 RepID=A0A9W6AQ47_ASPTU|nr:hypothetical protein AtubIFM55763_009126 [Aspergillus tubingensis]GLA85209.1 hypothetical protein AtubIFM56815_009440 [Aspergillus tubingensis]